MRYRISAAGKLLAILFLISPSCVLAGVVFAIDKQKIELGENKDHVIHAVELNNSVHDISKKDGLEVYEVKKNNSHIAYISFENDRLVYVRILSERNAISKDASIDLILNSIGELAALNKMKLYIKHSTSSISNVLTMLGDNQGLEVFSAKLNGKSFVDLYDLFYVDKSYVK